MLHPNVYKSSITQFMEQTNTPVVTTPEKKELAPVHSVFSSFPTKEEWNTLEVITKTFIAGGATPKGIDTAPKMMIVFQAAREIGLSPIEALNSLYFVNGKVAMYGEAVPTQIMRAGHKISWGTCDAREATVTITRGDTGESMTNTFTMAQAETRGYTKNPIYKTYPENMLKWRVLSMTAKFICPDALKGIGIKEEIEAETIQENSVFLDKGENKVAEVVASVKKGMPKKAKKSLDETLNAPETEDASSLPVVEPK